MKVQHPLRYFTLLIEKLTNVFPALIAVEFSLELVEHYEKPELPVEIWYLYTAVHAPASVVESLDHFGQTFRFPRAQCTDLLIQLLEKMGYSLWSPQDQDDGDDDEEEGNSVEILEHGMA